MKIVKVCSTSKKTGHENVTTWFGLRLKRAKNRKCEPMRTQSLIPPTRDDSILEEQESKFARVRKEENDYALVDSGTLRANVETLKRYLDDETIPIRDREKRQPEYTAILEEIARREKTKELV